MSSGALLLKQLQAQQRELAAKAREDQRRRNSNATRAAFDTERSSSDDSTVQNAGSSTTDKDKKVLDSHQANECSDNANAPVTVEVCLGPDCSGGGGGAALLEIESLVMGGGKQAGTGSKSNIRVVGGGCRDYCTMGPNVHIQSDFIAAEDSHFTRVNCSAECRRVVRVATGTSSSNGTCDDNSGEDDNADNIAKILQLREDGRRWRVLREQAAKERRLRVRERDKKSEG